ncbi:MAG TPA: UvrD-helicase domain-containing protein [Streptosporangiaceae bacterium]|nr:UvrD-helicase domain-containing protein [Streptosporangiaceae bacterium]
MFIADLHVHSRFSRACSKDCDIEHLSWWARRKGLSVLGTGDFTHPAWAAELRETLVPAEPGLFRTRPELEQRVIRDSPPACAGTVRFMLSVEISTIYRRADRTRKVHHLIYAPSFDAADRITAALARIGNLASDGRPILGLDSRDLLDIALSADPGCFLVPAHVWTPWFAVLGSKSGFDTVAECYADLAGHIFAVETGLSSDPPMNWTCSSLDPYRLVSNSDAHSPPMLGREATVFGTDLDYFAMAAALRTGHGLDGTIEFFPEEGKYHLDGHRKCGIRVDPEQASDLDAVCPRCGKPVTVGVLHRVAELADRPPGFRPPGAAGYTCLVQLPEIIGEIQGAGPKTKKVAAEIGRLAAALGPELGILRDVPLDDLRRAGGSLLSEAIRRLRRGEVIRDAGFDGEYGTIRLFGPDELDGTALFSVTGLSPAGRGHQDPAERATVSRAADRPSPRRRDATPAAAATATRASPATGSLLDGLDPDQRAAATAEGPLLIIAGPGTGKTRTLTHRIAYQVTECGVPARQVLALTFTRRAAVQMGDRLAVLGPGLDDELTVTTFHGLGLLILREYHDAAGLGPRFAVADETARLRVAAELTGSERDGRKLVAGLAEDPDGALALRKELIARDLVDFDGLTEMTAALLRDHPGVAAGLRARWPRISVDEYQDIDAVQYDLLRAISGDGAGLTAIGDPDQAIYGFRGADVGIFGRFTADFPAAATIELTRNYRSDPVIVTAAMQAMSPATLVPGRLAVAMRDDPAASGSSGPDPGDPLGAVTVHEAADEHAEAAWIAATIDQLLGGASFHALDSGRADGHDHGRLGLSDIAVLYRTDAQSGPLGQALTRAGLPFQKRSHDLLARRAGVAEIMHEMRLLNPAAPVPAGGTGEEVYRQLAAAVHALAAARGSRDASVLDVRAAGELLAPLARRCGADLERFRTEICTGAETDALDPRAEAVTLLTLHGAKGLEFDVVFLAGCESGLLPLRLPGSAPLAPALRGVDPAEERRLLFVGMTRARDKLLLSYARRRTRHGAEVPAGRSPFLAVIDPGLLGRAAPRRTRRTGDRQLRLL